MYSQCAWKFWRISSNCGIHYDTHSFMRQYAVPWRPNKDFHVQCKATRSHRTQPLKIKPTVKYQNLKVLVPSNQIFGTT